MWTTNPDFLSFNSRMRGTTFCLFNSISIPASSIHNSHLPLLRKPNLFFSLQSLHTNLDGGRDPSSIRLLFTTTSHPHMQATWNPRWHTRQNTDGCPSLYPLQTQNTLQPSSSAFWRRSRNGMEMGNRRDSFTASNILAPMSGERFAPSSNFVAFSYHMVHARFTYARIQHRPLQRRSSPKQGFEE